MSTPGVLRAWEHHALAYRKVWRANVAGSLIQPLIYLVGMGIGVGALVDRGESSSQVLDGLTYFQFFAPAMVATSAMMVAQLEATWLVASGFRWSRFFVAQSATSLTSNDISGGVALWHITKTAIASTGVAVVIALFPSTRSLGLVLTALFGALTGAVFASIIMAWSASRETEASFAVIARIIVMPMFLFSGAFYPISALPDWIEPVAWITPLWHGVSLCRDAAYGRLVVGETLGRVAYLVVLWVVGFVIARRVFARRLAS